MHPFQKSVRALAAFAALALQLAACTDALPPTAPGVPSAAVMRGASVRDAAIRRDDSHFSARVEITRSGDGATGTAFRLAAPEAAITLDAPSPDTVFVEGGYGAAGEIHFGIYWNARTPSFDFAGMRAIGDRVEMLSAAGAVISSQPFDAQMAEAGLPGGTLVGAFFPAGEPGLVTCPPSDPLCGTGVDLRASNAAADIAANASATAPVGTTREVRRTHRRAPGRGPQISASDRTEVVRRYRKVADNAWRLEEVRSTDYVTTGQGPRVTLTVMQVTYGAWYRDAAHEAARDAARAARPLARTGVARAPLAGAEAVATPPDGEAAILDQLCARSPYEVDVVRSKSIKGLAILYQHGFCSDASVWDGMRPRLSSTFTVQRERAFSLVTTGRVDAQVDELIQRLRAAGVRPNLVIGHSLGGLVGRRLGQRDSALVSGVITIGSPHLGALGADIAPEYAVDLLSGAVGNVCVGAWLCQAVTKLLVESNSGRLLHGVPGLGSLAPQDLSTNSPFIQTLNSTREAFPRAGIEVNAGNRWAIFRMLGDARSPRTPVIQGIRPDGHEWVKDAEEIYFSARLLQFLSFFARFEVSPYGGGVDCSQSGYAGYWTPCIDYDWADQWDTPSYGDFIASLMYHLSTIVIRTMDFVDLTWDWITTRNSDLTDGLIALRSQRYPASPGRFVPMRVLITPPDAESHAGETASPRVVDRTIDLVRALGLGGQ